MLATCLIPPRPEIGWGPPCSAQRGTCISANLLWETNACHSKGPKECLRFWHERLDSFELEVIGGNHRREMISRIMATFPDAKTNKEPYKFVYVQIYAGELFIDCAQNLSTLELSRNRVSIKCVVCKKTWTRTQPWIFACLFLLLALSRNRNENSVYLFYVCWLIWVMNITALIDQFWTRCKPELSHTIYEITKPPVASLRKL